MAKKKPVAARTAKLAEWPFPVGDAKPTTPAKAPAKKKAEPKKKYICVGENSNAGLPQDTVEKAYQSFLDEAAVVDNEYPADDCAFYEVKEVKVVAGIRLA